MRRAAALSLALLASCVSFEYNRTLQEAPLHEDAVAELVPGRDDVASCLQRLGAPTHVWPRASGELALAYGWAQSTSWGVQVSVALRGTSAPVFDFDSLGSRTVGYVLWFDRDWRYQRSDYGHLEDLRRGLEHERSAARFDEHAPGSP
jgi:hypothetical protein